MAQQTRSRVMTYVNAHKNQLGNNFFFNIWRDCICDKVIPTITTRTVLENNTFIYETHK